MRWSEPLGGILLCLVLLGCQPQIEPSAEAPPVMPPPGFPPVPVPPDNPITAEQRELGRRLFYDPAVLSPNGTIACASCHRQARAFSDALGLSVGIHGRKHWRSTLPLFNVAYAPALLWDGSIASIEEDVLVTLRAALTLGWRDTAEFAQRLRESPSYRAAFRRAFGQEPSALLAARAIATFVRTIFSGASAYDRFRQGDSSALTPAQQRGMRIFFRVGCAECHPPPLFTDYQYHATGMLAHYWEAGRASVTGNPGDYARFRTPTLRNVALTAPYLHDGSVGSLRELLRRYNAGGYPLPNKDARIRPLGLSEPELQDLEDFLQSLTDSLLLRNPDYAAP